MVKYDSKLKSMIINEHLNNDVIGAFLDQKYDLPRNIVNTWIKKFHLGRISTVKRRKGKRVFSTEFKLNVIDYYQTHEESLTEVAIKYDILACQISMWRTKFNRDGIGL
ncbi:Transposase [Paucilactobacillus oligofermentans DSM 15707 = LMG 22743]|uniref:transposase n=1 Tax=Paucilactobacillus oligofermentans TaxID=293371 RepID=UPI00078E192C|nr:transposase [Paucilactobacillus oligofermentans]CUS26335.1 Transposase [Paucilactobacillus oligofermentans DSM 15707 = LMG 22743]